MTRLSEHILLGAMLKPQGFSCGSEHSAALATCALGAAAESMGFASAFSDEMRSAFPLFDRNAEHPVRGFLAPMDGIIVDLNDMEKWTREDIARWVQSIEDQQESAAAAPAEESTPVQRIAEHAEVIA